MNVTSQESAMASWVSAAWIASVLDEHAAALELFASQWTDLPEDCVQDAILELTRQSRPPINVTAWLFDVVRKRAISANRSATRRRKHETFAARLVKISTESQPESIDTEDLAIAISQLDDDVREIVVARTWGGLGFAEIAAMLGMSAATTFRRYEAGLKSLRMRLEFRCNPTNQKQPQTPNCPAT